MIHKIYQLVSMAILLLRLWPAVSFTSSPTSHSNVQISLHDGLNSRSGKQCQSFNAKSRRTSSATNTQIRASSVNGEQTNGSSSSSNNIPVGDKAKIEEAMEAEFDDTAILVQFELTEHKPLGCTVEETVVEDCNYVFVSKIVPGGFAYQAGLQVGDVVVATNGMFSDTDSTIVVNSGVDEIKRLVGALPEDKTLHLAVARGTDVMEQHEEFLVELCSLEGPNDKQLEGSISKFLADGYCNDYGSDEDDVVAGDDDEDLVSAMNDIWASELPPPPSIDGSNLEQPKDTAEKIKPWSSRSSPSGTFVRDPVTGEMKNIDSTDWSSGSGSS